MKGDTKIKDKLDEGLPSGDLVLSILQREFDIERERKSALETRTGILLTLTFAILTISISNIKIPKILNIEDSKIMMLYFIYVLLLFILFVFSVSSIFFFIKVLLLDKYKRMDVSTFNERLALHEKKATLPILIDKYREYIIFNQKTNDRKYESYKKGTISIIITFSLSVILYTISAFI